MSFPQGAAAPALLICDGIAQGLLVGELSLRHPNSTTLASALIQVSPEIQRLALIESFSDSINCQFHISANI